MTLDGSSQTRIKWRDEEKKNLWELRVSERGTIIRAESRKMTKRNMTKGVLEKFTVEFQGNSKDFSKINLSMTS